MKVLIKEFLNILAIITAVTLIVSFMSCKTYEFPLSTHIGTGMAAAGAFVFIFLGFGSMRGFFTKTCIGDICNIGGPAYGEATHGRNYKNRVEIVTKRTYLGDTMLIRTIEYLMPFVAGAAFVIAGLLLIY